MHDYNEFTCEKEVTLANPSSKICCVFFPRLCFYASKVKFYFRFKTLYFSSPDLNMKLLIIYSFCWFFQTTAHQRMIFMFLLTTLKIRTLWSLHASLNVCIYICMKLCFELIVFYPYHFVIVMRGSRGGGGTGGPDPPWDLSDVGSCVDVWWVGEGSKGCFHLILIFFSGSLRSPVSYIV